MTRLVTVACHASGGMFALATLGVLVEFAAGWERPLAVLVTAAVGALSGALTGAYAVLAEESPAREPGPFVRADYMRLWRAFGAGAWLALALSPAWLTFGALAWALARRLA